MAFRLPKLFVSILLCAAATGCVYHPKDFPRYDLEPVAVVPESESAPSVIERPAEAGSGSFHSFYPNYVRVVGLDFLPVTYTRKSVVSNPLPDNLEYSLRSVPVELLISELQHRIRTNDNGAKTATEMVNLLDAFQQSLNTLKPVLRQQAQAATSAYKPSSSNPLPLSVESPNHVETASLEWLFQARDGKKYTAQLITMKKRGTVEQYIDSLKLDRSLIRILKFVDSKDIEWHFAIYGEFDSFRHAQSEIETTLPEKLGKNSLVRSLHSIRQAYCGSFHAQSQLPEHIYTQCNDILH